MISGDAQPFTAHILDINITTADSIYPIPLSKQMIICNILEKKHNPFPLEVIKRDLKASNSSWFIQQFLLLDFRFIVIIIILLCYNTLEGF